MSGGYSTVDIQGDTVEPDLSPDEDDLVAISGKQFKNGSKGKGRAGDTLAPPSRGSSRSSSPAAGSAPSGVSGKIGSSGQRASRTQIGGIALETRYTGANTLEESVGESIVRTAIDINFNIIPLSRNICRPASSFAIYEQYTTRCFRSCDQAESTRLCATGISGALFFSQLLWLSYFRWTPRQLNHYQSSQGCSSL